MPSWSSSEDENHFKLRPTDFTLTNIAHECSAQPRDAVDFLHSTSGALKTHQNYFYNKLGFKVGEHFAGEKKLYQKRK